MIEVTKSRFTKERMLVMVMMMMMKRAAEGTKSEDQQLV